MLNVYHLIYLGMVFDGSSGETGMCNFNETIFLQKIGFLFIFCKTKQCSKITIYNFFEDVQPFE